MHRVGVGSGMHSDGTNAHFAGSADHPKGNFAAIGNQDFINHCQGLVDLGL